MKYSITLQVKQYEKKCSVLIFLMKNEKKDRKNSLPEHNFNAVFSEFR